MTALEYYARRQEMKNGEGYQDPTASQAIANAGKIPRYIRDILEKLNEAARIHDLEVIVMRDTKTGRIYDSRYGSRKK